MLSIKRFYLFILSIFLLFFIVVGSSVYFFNVNDYSLWITKQILQSTGYDVRFETFENRWLADNYLSITGLSLYQQQQRVLLINRLELQVDKLDLWSRQLEIGSVKLTGLQVDIQQPLNLTQKTVEADDKTERQSTDLQNIAWEKLHIKQFQIIDLNASLFHEGKQLQLTKAGFELNNLLIIEQKKLQLLPQHIDFKTNFKQLMLNDTEQKARLVDFQLAVEGYLPQRQAELEMSVGNIQFESPQSASIHLNALSLNLQLEDNRLLLQEFMVDLFSGSLNISGQAQLAIKLLPIPTLTIERVAVNSLTAKDMQLNIPALMQSNDESQPATDKKQLPIAELWIEKLNIKNVTVSSGSELQPLLLKSVDAQLNNLYLIQDHQLLDIAKLNEQSASFSLAFDYLRWQKSVVEQFSIAGSLQKDDPAWQLLKSFVVEK
ncbi:MAG: hypothetical protein GY787_00270 [Alteromonadales bacterium]|nr:hypothetical protein [Alteromonadales bacterium]